MKKKEKEKNTMRKNKEKKVKDPKEYIPPQLLSSLRDYILINL